MWCREGWVWVNTFSSIVCVRACDRRCPFDISLTHTHTHTPPPPPTSLCTTTNQPPPPNNHRHHAYVRTRVQELIDIIETIYRGARKGRGLVISPKDYSTKYRY